MAPPLTLANTPRSCGKKHCTQSDSPKSRNRRLPGAECKSPALAKRKRVRALTGRGVVGCADDARCAAAYRSGPERGRPNGEREGQRRRAGSIRSRGLLGPLDNWERADRRRPSERAKRASRAVGARGAGYAARGQRRLSAAASAASASACERSLSWGELSSVIQYSP